MAQWTENRGDLRSAGGLPLTPRDTPHCSTAGQPLPPSQAVGRAWVAAPATDQHAPGFLVHNPGGGGLCPQQATPCGVGGHLARANPCQSQIPLKKAISAPPPRECAVAPRAPNSQRVPPGGGILPLPSCPAPAKGEGVTSTPPKTIHSHSARKPPSRVVVIGGEGAAFESKGNCHRG